MLTPIATRIQACLLPMLLCGLLSLALGACSDSVTEDKTPSDAMDPEPTPDLNPEPTPNPDVTPDPMPGPEPEPGEPIRAVLFLEDAFGVAQSTFEFNAETEQYETFLPNDTNDYVLNPGATSWWIEVEDTATGESWTLRESEAGNRRVGFSTRELSAEGTRNPVILSATYHHVVVSAPSLGREATVDWTPNPDFYSPTGEQYDATPWEVSSAETLDGVIEAMDGLDDENRRAFWQGEQSELQRSGGMPVSLGLERHFLFYDMLAASPEEAGPFAVGAEWRDWDPSALPMAQVEGTRWFWATDVIRNTARAQYKLVYLPTEVWFQDPSNPNMVWDGFDKGTVGAFNSEVHFDAVDNGRGRTVALQGVFSPQLDNRRDVYVHLPPGYDDGDDARFPIMIFHDGNESLTRADFARVMDDWSVETGRQVIGVFVHLPSQNVRLSEYTFLEEGSRGDAYADFLVETLLPLVDEEFRTIPEANARAIHGMSLGGLISYYVAMRHPTVFGRVGGMSSSFFWADLALIDMYRNAEMLPVSKFYLDSGSPDDNFDVTQIMAGVLEDKGYDVTHVVDEGGTHDWSFWHNRLPGALNSLWAGF